MTLASYAREGAHALPCTLLDQTWLASERHTHKSKNKKGLHPALHICNAMLDAQQIISTDLGRRTMSSSLARSFALLYRGKHGRGDLRLAPAFCWRRTFTASGRRRGGANEDFLKWFRETSGSGTSSSISNTGDATRPASLPRLQQDRDRAPLPFFTW